MAARSTLPDRIAGFQPDLNHLTFRSYSELYEPSDDTFLFMDGEFASHVLRALAVDLRPNSFAGTFQASVLTTPFCDASLRESWLRSGPAVAQ